MTAPRMTEWVCCLALAGALGAGAAGCGGNVPAPADSVAEQAPATGAGESVRPSVATAGESADSTSQPSQSNEEIVLREIDGEGLRATVAAHQGNVVLVDMWATWCIPCREKFPHVVELHRRHSGEGLSVISLSVDEPGARVEVLEFLKEQQAKFENLIGTYGLGAEAIEAFEYGGEVPFYKLYDRQGQLRYQFSGDPREGIEPIENLDRRVSELLAERG